MVGAGEGIAVLASDPKPSWAIMIPNVLPGERVRARVYRHARMHSFADLVEVLEPNKEMRDDSRVKCKYFGECAGCQYQMLDYETQLKLKQDVIIKAYKNYSHIPSAHLPSILSTIPSPKQYGYRTKLTPHFEAPPRKWRNGINKGSVSWPPPEGEELEWLKIGFNKIGTRKTMDIEECPIATPVINRALKPVRAYIQNNIIDYNKGVSLVFRDSLDGGEKHICITSHNGTVRERVGPFLFDYHASSFFQNNNAVLTPLVEYVRDSIFPEATTTPTHLVDTYCGAGLFAINLSPYFQTISGIELSAESIRAATHNATMNSIPSSKISFRAGDATEIFRTVHEFPRDKTVVVIDPPRKGCDEAFLKQLVLFGADVVVYVSCNVHTQARDVGWILEKTGTFEGRKGAYRLESLRGFDLFPQTAHVESVAVLRRI
ncbi:S-adenosyl-L-methionine-dependent methyltransferase [Cyathus striatus]|nr:S-adenosyl-L-methionine-dependent methyltransferase [Cyathus striatus]